MNLSYRPPFAAVLVSTTLAVGVVATAPASPVLKVMAHAKKGPKHQYAWSTPESAGNGIYVSWRKGDNDIRERGSILLRIENRGSKQVLGTLKFEIEDPKPDSLYGPNGSIGGGAFVDQSQPLAQNPNTTNEEEGLWFSVPHAPLSADGWTSFKPRVRNFSVKLG